jgi:hypothetical protein
VGSRSVTWRRIAAYLLVAHLIAYLSMMLTVRVMAPDVPVPGGILARLFD